MDAWANNFVFFYTPKFEFVVVTAGWRGRKPPDIIRLLLRIFYFIKHIFLKETTDSPYTEL